MAEPPYKKRMDDMQIFTDFLRDPQNIKTLTHAYTMIKQGYEQMKLGILKITCTNACSKTCFSRATCDVKLYPSPETNLPRAYTVGCVFLKGVYFLEQYLNSATQDTVNIPEDTGARKALGKLLKFLASSKFSTPKPLENFRKKGGDKREWAVLIVQHLLSELSIGSNYTIDQHYNKNKISSLEECFVCPCEVKDELVGCFGNTSFGCVEAWHGHVDIIMENILPVSILGENSDDSSSELELDTSEHSAEVEGSGGFSPKDERQIRAQTIVFSFLHQNTFHSLIPSLGISRDSMMVHFYDNKNDILLASVPLNLFAENGRLVPAVLVFLWLTVNYRCFSSGIIEDMREYKAEFFNRVGDFIGRYRNDVVRPLPNITPQKEDNTHAWSLTEIPIGAELECTCKPGIKQLTNMVQN